MQLCLLIILFVGWEINLFFVTLRSRWLSVPYRGLAIVHSLLAQRVALYCLTNTNYFGPGPSFLLIVNHFHSFCSCEALNICECTEHRSISCSDCRHFAPADFGFYLRL